MPTGYTVTASAANYVTGTNGSVTVTAGGTTIGVNFALSLVTGTITGTVANNAGGVAGANVSVLVGGTTYPATAQTDPIGAYTITAVPVGTDYTVTASMAGYANGTATGVNVTAGNTTANVTITLNVSCAAWTAAVFTTAQLADPTISGETANPVHDGVSNLLKYAFKLNPLVPNRSGLPVVGTIMSGGSQYLTTTYTTRPLAGDLTYSVQASTDLVNWTAITTPAAATISPVTVQDPTALSPGTCRFLRVQVIGP